MSIPIDPIAACVGHRRRGPKPPCRTHRCSLVLPEELYLWLWDQSQADGVGLSCTLRHALEDFRARKTSQRVEVSAADTATASD